MTFAAVNSVYADLRGAVCAYESAAMREVVVRPPADIADEASFVRLVGWSYALLYEAGRVTLPYILRLPIGGATSTSSLQTRGLIAELRTWLFHNLGFESDRDMEIRQRANQWCNAVCGATTPSTSEQWEKCFAALCKSLLDLLEHCNQVFSHISASTEDRDAFFLGLRSQLNRTYEPQQFDRIVEESTNIMGESINVRAFRSARIADWRAFMADLPEDADLVAEITRRIESELVAHVQSRLPVTGRDIMDALGMAPGPEVKRALDRARALFESGVRDRSALLEKLAEPI